jgi:hypothetical protein
MLLMRGTQWKGIHIPKRRPFHDAGTRSEDNTIHDRRSTKHREGTLAKIWSFVIKG